MNTNDAMARLVPPMEMCADIPDGSFDDSALVWVVKSRGECEIWHRDRSGTLPKSWFRVPAPTLEEIMVAVLKEGGRGYVIASTISRESCEVIYKNKSAAKAALKRWLNLKGI